MTAYATQADFEAYIEGFGLAVGDAAAIARLLERATSDVDEVLGPLAFLTIGDYAGRKVDPTALFDHEAQALARATCAQAEHRFRYVEPAAAAATAAAANPDQPSSRAVKSIEGPDFKKTYGDAAAAPGVAGSGRFDPRLPAELAPLARIRRLRGRVSA